MSWTKQHNIVVTTTVVTFVTYLFFFGSFIFIFGCSRLILFSLSLFSLFSSTYPPKAYAPRAKFCMSSAVVSSGFRSFRTNILPLVMKNTMGVPFRSNRFCHMVHLSTLTRATLTSLSLRSDAAEVYVCSIALQYPHQGA